MLIIGKRGYDIYGLELEQLGYETYPLKALEGLNGIVCDHADTLICRCGKLILPEKVASFLPKNISEHMIKSSDFPFGEYPNDVMFNALCVKNYLFGRVESLSGDVKDYAAKHGIGLIDVKQGYAQCSALVVGEAVLTADVGIAKKMQKLGIDVLLLPFGDILLEGCEYGFIGGAGFADSKNHKVVFFGKLPKTYSDDVKEFCEKQSYSVTELSGQLRDVGGAVLV